MSAGWLLPPDVLASSPSRADSVSEQDEKTYRRRTAIFMEQAGEDLSFPRLTIATAQVFFHRFYALQSFKKYKRFEIAVTCLFLAGKVEERPRKLESVITQCHKTWNRDKPTLSPQMKTEDGRLVENPEYEAMRQQILKCERILLHTIAFDLCVKHPYKTLITTVKRLKERGLIQDRQKKEFAQNALNFLNDSMRTSLCLQFEPAKIASATIYLANVFLNKGVQDSNAEIWMESLDITAAELQSIVTQIMEVYAQQLQDTSGEHANLQLMHQHLRVAGLVGSSTPGGASGKRSSAPRDGADARAKRPRPDSAGQQSGNLGKP